MFFPLKLALDHRDFQQVYEDWQHFVIAAIETEVLLTLGNTTSVALHVAKLRRLHMA